MASIRYAIGVPAVGEYGDPRVIAELAREADQSGWDGFFIWEHVLYHEPSTAVVDSTVALAAAAMVTDHVRLGAMVTPIARRRPWKLARETASLDVLSGGRLVLGAGLGSMDEEYAAFGEDADPRVRAEKLDEGLEILAGLWSGEPFSFAGRHLRVESAQMRPPPLQTPRIPVWVGGRWPNKAPFRRAARWDGVMPTHSDYPLGETMPPADLRAALEYIAAHRAAPAPFDVVLEGRTDGSDPEAAAEKVRPYIEVGITWWVEALGWWRGPLATARERIGQGPPRA
ncbi:MAG TPA: LLM class flavin-dependent oxidoreductase [Egibacteraceae bacterium]|nr:LLM class flavin-dependent oxidoreductase [Egibacteraceae bacterium]